LKEKGIRREGNKGNKGNKGVNVTHIKYNTNYEK